MKEWCSTRIILKRMRHETDVSELAKRTIAWGILGTGAVALRFAQGLSLVPESKLVSIWGRNGQATATLAGQTNARACPNFESLLRSNIDALYIATLPERHAEYSIAALQAGRHVVFEKS